VRRQRYECVVKDAAGVVTHTHWFTQVLPRDHIGDRHLSCRECEEAISVHKGAQASSRRSSWPVGAVVDALAELAQGMSYGQASTNLWDRAAAARAHLAAHAPDADAETVEEPAATAAPDEVPPPEELGAEEDTNEPEVAVLVEVVDAEQVPQPESGSWIAVRRRSAWHLAADLVEQYSPVLFEHVIAPIREREREVRVANDAVRAAGGVPELPLTFVLDEVPVYVRMRGAAASRVSWTILSVAEVWWRPGRKPGQYLRENRLRLARAFPGPADTEAWLLVLHELGVVPDVVVADFGLAIDAAVTLYYRDHDLLRVPSLFHFTQAMRRMLTDTPGYSTGRGKTREALELFDEHLRLVDRDWLVTGGVGGWDRWWVEFERLAVSVGAPVKPLTNRRDIYKPVIAAAIPALTAQPHLPASNSGIELKNRNLLKGVLRGRSQRYRNLARTNGLLDLVVCADHGLFLDRSTVSGILRADNLAQGRDGWATRMRTYDDPQPPVLVDDDTISDSFAVRPSLLPEGQEPKRRRKYKRGQPRYSSLLDPGLVPALLEARLFADGGELP